MALKQGNGGAERGERDSRLDLLYRDTPREAPPAHLDAAIQAAARREVGARPRSVSSRLLRWRVPLSLAAVVVLSVTLVTLIGEEGKDTFLSDMRYMAAPPVAQREQDAQAKPADRAKAPEARRAAPATPETFALLRDESAAKAAAERRDAQEREETRSTAAPAAEADRGAAPIAGATSGILSS